MNQPITLLEAKNLQVKKGGATLLDVPSLHIESGEILSLIGPNGAGKTTLLQSLSCLIRPSAGEVFFKGEDVNSSSSALTYRRKLAMVFQEALLFNTTVFNNVASGLRIRGEGRGEIRRIVRENLNRFGIGHLQDRSARTLSGGEAQRTSLARAFAIQPEILFLDEPFASLDLPSRESLVADLEMVLRETRTTTVLATHDRMEAIRLSDRMVVMNAGKILQIGVPGEVTHQPVNEFVASFVGVETILNGKVAKIDGGTFIAEVHKKEIEAVGNFRVGEGVVLCIRPENVTLSTHLSGEPTSARNAFIGRIVKIAPLGLYQRVQLDCGFPLVAYVTTHSLEELLLTPGKEVRVSFKATAIHVLRRGEKQ